MRNKFAAFARKVSDLAGRPLAFVLALALVVVWALTGPLFDYSSGWQLFINSTTTVITFLMVFVLQSSQARDTRALQIKLDELICTSEKASNQLVSIEDDNEQHLSEVQEAVRAQKP